MEPNVRGLDEDVYQLHSQIQKVCVCTIILTTCNRTTLALNGRPVPLREEPTHASSALLITRRFQVTGGDQIPQYLTVERLCPTPEKHCICRVYVTLGSQRCTSECFCKTPPLLRCPLRIFFLRKHNRQSFLQRTAVLKYLLGYLQFTLIYFLVDPWT